MLRPTDEQQFVVQQAVNWFYRSPEQVFQYDGAPGTGKSFVLNLIIQALGLDPKTEVAAMSFIGSASLVMRSKGLYSAKTAHSWIYNPVEVFARDDNGIPIINPETNKHVFVTKFVPVDALDPDIKLIVVDEGYSMPFHMRKDILKFGLKVLVCGDRNQLPPVKDNPAFLADGKIYHLTQCMRQQNAMDIYRIANLVSNGIEPLNGYYGNSLVIDHKDLTLDMLLWADAIVVGKNSTRDRINKMIRKALGYNGDMPNMGERVVCRSNEWDIALLLEDGYSISPVNGLICKVLSSPDVFSLNKDGTFTMTCQSMILPDAIFTNLDVNFGYINADYETRNAIKNNSKYHRGCLFEYAYCITAHIAQGSQFHKVVYIEEHMPRNIQNNINLVGASRADEALIYVKA